MIRLYVFLSFTLLMLTSLLGCGAVEEFAGSKCGGDLKQLCHMLTGGKQDYEQDQTLQDHQSQIDNLAGRLYSLERLFTLLYSQSNVLQSHVDSLEASNSAHSQTINELTDLLNAISLELTTTTMSIAELSGYNNIVEIITPCPELHSPSGYKEILLRTSNGQLLAYFEVAGRRYLTTLKPDSTYQTTDGSGCMFETRSDMSLDW